MLAYIILEQKINELQNKVEFLEKLTEEHTELILKLTKE